LQIVREHKGELQYRYADGKVIFSVRLPLAGVVAEDAAKDAAPQ